MDNIYIDTRYGFSWTRKPNEVLKGHLKQLLKGSKRTYIEVHRDLLAEIAAVLADTPAAAAEVSDMREALFALLDHVDRETCTHESTHRGGAIWTICDDCGRQWSDDRNPFKPHEDAPAVANARAILALRTADHAERK